MRRIAAGRVCYAMSRENPPVARVGRGESFCVETKDCYSNTITSAQDAYDKSRCGRPNPATGPVYVEGAVAGDVLRIDIERIDVRDFAAMCVGPGMGAVGHLVREAETRIIPIRDGRLEIAEDFSLAVNPMVGVIGTAPAEGEVPNSTPGEHGGNMDCKEIAAGASLYVPVCVEGALLALGDIHALQGDGEVCICAAEVSGEVQLCVDVMQTPLPTPCVENEEHVMFLASASTLDECERAAIDKAHRYLTKCLGLGINDSVRLMSLLGELGVCQVVDPLKTMKFMLPKALLRSLGMGPRATDFGARP